MPSFIHQPFPLKEIRIHELTGDTMITPQNYIVLMVLQGSILVRSESGTNSYTLQDLLVLLPGGRYQMTPQDANIILTVAVESNYLLDYIGSSCQIICDSRLYPNQMYDRLRNLMAAIASGYYNADQSNPFQNYALAYSLIAELTDHFLVNTLTLSGSSAKHEERVREITRYIDEHYASALSLNSLAQIFFLSPQYLSRFFRQNMHQSYLEYLNHVRMEHAVADLRFTDSAITKIAYNNGFTNLTTFNRIFKSMYKTTPSRYRRDYQRGRRQEESMSDSPMTDTDQKKLSLAVSGILDFPDHPEPDILPESAEAQPSAGMPGNNYAARISAASNLPANNGFIRLINAGFAVNMLSYSFRQHLDEALSVIRFECVRFSGILDDDILPLMQDGQTFSFTLTDRILDLLVSRHLTPFLELSPKPRKTLAAITASGFPKAPQGKDTAARDTSDPDFIYIKLDALIRHCINRYGTDTVAEWYFEVWATHNEYLIYEESPEQYLLRFKRFSEILHCYLPETRIGGPGFNSVLPQRHFTRLLNVISEDGIQPAFISVYAFPYTGRLDSESPDSGTASYGDYLIYSPDPNVIPRRIDEILRIIRSVFTAPIPLLITEYASDLSGRNRISDSCFQAAFISKTFLDLRTRADMTAYWFLSDLTQVYAQGSTASGAGIGLMDEDGQKKPAFYAYNLISRICECDRILFQGPGLIAGCKNDTVYRILAFNYAHISSYYCLNYTEPVPAENTYSVFEPVHAVSLSLTLCDILPGQYKVRRYLLNREHGSFLDTFSKTYYQSDPELNHMHYSILSLLPDERTYYEQTCVPELSIFYRDSKGQLTLNCQLAAHEVIYFEIQRLY